MTSPDISALQSQLKRTLKSLDGAIARVQPLDPKLRRAFADMYVHRDDELGRLLAEVGQKAGLLDSARLRAGYLHRYGDPGSANVSASEIHIASSHGAQEGLSSLDADLPQPAHHGDITIRVTALAESSGRYHLRFQLTSEGSFSGAMPLLAGVRVTDQTGRAYPIENGHEAQTNEGATSQLTGALSFTPDPGAPLTAVTLTIAAVLFADRQAFLVTEAPARLVEGPWAFSIAMPQVR